MTITVFHSDVHKGTFTINSPHPVKDHEIGAILGAYNPTVTEPYTVGDYTVTFVSELDTTFPTPKEVATAEDAPVDKPKR